MKEKPSQAKSQDKLPAEYLTVDYPPPSNPEEIPVRGGKRTPDKDELPTSNDPTMRPREQS